MKIKARLLDAKDIEERKLPNQTTGLVITEIQKGSPMNNVEVNYIILEVQKKRINYILSGASIPSKPNDAFRVFNILSC